MDLDVVFLGTSAALPTARRGVSAHLLRRGGERLLVDCGEGTQRQLLRSGVGLVEIDDVFLTHFHADHYLGLPGLLKTFDLRGREKPMTVYGPPGLLELFRSLGRIFGRVRYPLGLAEVAPGQTIARDGYVVRTAATVHGLAGLAYRFAEPDRPGEFDPARATALGVAAGPDFGRLQRGETVGGVAPGQVMGPPRAGRSVVFSGDTRPCEAVTELARGADVLIHDATFTTEDREHAFSTGHSTAAEAADVANAAGVKLLVCTHLSARYPARAIREEAERVRPASVVAHDFDRVVVPLPERGEPELVRRERPARPGADDEAEAEDPTAAPTAVL